jgi:hypothetical protein
MVITFPPRARRTATNLAQASALDWVSAEKAEQERARAEEEAGVAVHTATLPRSNLLGPAPGGAKPLFTARELPFGNQFCAQVTLPDGRVVNVGTFKTAAHAQAWIDRSSAAWLGATE